MSNLATDLIGVVRRYHEKAQADGLPPEEIARLFTGSLIAVVLHCGRSGIIPSGEAANVFGIHARP